MAFSLFILKKPHLLTFWRRSTRSPRARRSSSAAACRSRACRFVNSAQFRNLDPARSSPEAGCLWLLLQRPSHALSVRQSAGVSRQS